MVFVATTVQALQVPDWLSIPGRVTIWMFFGISGYAIASGFIHDQHKNVLTGYPQYALRRICRIFPIFWLTSLIAIALLLWREMPLPFDFSGGIRKLLALHWAPDYKLMTAFWTLSIWVQFYLIAPFIVAAIIFSRRFGGVVAFGLWLILVITLGNDPDNRSVIAALQHFLAGMFVARIKFEPETRRLLSIPFFWPFAIAVGIVSLSIASTYFHNDILRFWNFRGGLLADLAIVALLLAHCSIEQRDYKSNVITRALMIAGILSYGVYAWHGLLLTYFPLFSEKMVFLSMASLMLAYLSFITLERPLIVWSRRQNQLTTGSRALADITAERIEATLAYGTGILNSFSDRTEELRQKLLPAIIVYLVFGTIAATVFANQPNHAMQLIGRGFHFLNIASGAYLVVIVIGLGATAYIALTGMLFLLDKLTGIRLPYIIFLNVLFLFAGAVVVVRHRHLVTKTLIAIVVVSGAIMFLQVAGVGEWTQALTTHGFISDTLSLSKAPEPTLFVSYLDTAANFLQGRPAGLFHANQFASLIVVVTLALTMAQSGKRSMLLDTLVCVTAVLTMAKVVILALILLAGYFFLFTGQDGKRIAFRFGFLSAAALAAYAVLFPGLIQVYLFSGQTIWVSIFARVLELGSMVFAWDIGDQQTVVSELSNRFKAKIYYDQHFETAQTLPTPGNDKSALPPLLRSAPIILSGMAIGFMIVASNARIRKSLYDWFRLNISTESTTVLIALASFCLAANFLDAQIFWFFVGFAVPLLRLHAPDK